MVLAEETGQPGELLVRFKASQRELLLDELELFKSTSEDGIAVVSEREHPNPRYLAVKERERDDAQKLISAIVGTVDTEETFEVIAPAYLLCSCIRPGWYAKSCLGAWTSYAPASTRRAPKSTCNAPATTPTPGCAPSSR